MVGEETRVPQEKTSGLGRLYFVLFVASFPLSFPIVWWRAARRGEGLGKGGRLVGMLWLASLPVTVVAVMIALRHGWSNLAMATVAFLAWIGIVAAVLVSFTGLVALVHRLFGRGRRSR